MSRRCVLTGKRRLVGHNVSHSNRRTKRVFNINLQNKRIFVPWLSRFVRLRLSTQALRLIDKVGLEGAIRRLSKIDKKLYKIVSSRLGLQN